LAYVLVHIPISRIQKGRAPLIGLLWAAAGGGLVTLGLGLWAARAGNVDSLDAAGSLILSCISYLGLAWCYFNFVNLNLSSLRFRLLRELRLAPDGLAGEDIVARYNADRIISRRLEQWSGSGHLCLLNQRYVVGNRFFLLVFDILEVLKLAVLGHGHRLLPDISGTAGAPRVLPPLQRLSRMAQIIWSYSFLRFILVGMVNTLFSFCLYSALVLLGIPYKIALTLTSIVAQIWNFMTTGHLVFGNRRKRLFFKFIGVSGSIYLLNLAALTLLVEVLQWGELASQAILIPLVITVSFLINRSWVFQADGLEKRTATVRDP
jgi:putative flippase GtrA